MPLGWDKPVTFCPFAWPRWCNWHLTPCLRQPKWIARKLPWVCATPMQESADYLTIMASWQINNCSHVWNSETSLKGCRPNLVFGRWHSSDTMSHPLPTQPKVAFYFTGRIPRQVRPVWDERSAPKETPVKGPWQGSSNWSSLDNHFCLTNKSTGNTDKVIKKTTSKTTEKTKKELRKKQRTWLGHQSQKLSGDSVDVFKVLDSNAGKASIHVLDR